MEATIGIRMASATFCSMVASNRPMTMEARIAVPRLTSSQTKRLRVVRSTVSVMDSWPTPPSRWMSSSASSWITSTMSSTVITPIMRWFSSTTGAEIRS